MTTPSTTALETQLTEALEALKAARAAEAAAATVPDDLTIYLHQDAPNSLTLGGLLLRQGDTVTITRTMWEGMLPAARDDLLDLVQNRKRQHKLFGGVYLHEGVGPRVEAEVGSDAWRLQRRRDWDNANAMPSGDAKVAELARLHEFYTSEEQTPREGSKVVKSTIIARYRGDNEAPFTPNTPALRQR